MRIFVDIGLVVVAFVAVFVVIGQCSAAERYKITNERRQVIGDIYDPGHGRRLQIRDDRRRIIGYIESDGDVTDKRRRKVGKIKELLGGD